MGAYTDAMREVLIEEGAITVEETSTKVRFKLSGQYTVEGGYFPITIEDDFDPALDQTLHDAVSWWAKQGVMPLSSAANAPRGNAAPTNGGNYRQNNNGGGGQQQGGGEGGTIWVTDGWCPNHQRDLIPSKKGPGLFCPTKLPDNSWCKVKQR